MAQKRIEWTCPECGKRFAIPANANMPERCPTCQQSATQKGTPPAKAPPPLPATPPTDTAIETPLPHFEEMSPEPAETKVPSISVPAQQRSRTSNRNLPRKYPSLRALSLACRVLGGFVLALTFYFNVRTSVYFSQSEVRESFKSSSTYVATVIELNIAILLVGCFWGIIAFATAELIILFIDIAENTRIKRGE